jgi:hypothetical protein
MARQLKLLDTPPSWRIDEATRQLGRKGIAEARARLREAAAGAARADRPGSPAPRRSAA